MRFDSPIIQYLMAWAHHLANDERGEVTEKALITAIFASLAIAVGAIIVAKVTGIAEGIPDSAPFGG